MPRHGGSDPGAVGNGITEKDLALEISKYMYERLKTLGIPVKMTRTTDETIDAKNRSKRILDAFGNDKDVIVISNHINAGGGDGAEVIYALRNNSTLSKKILDNLEKDGLKIRKYYQQRLPSNSKKDYYFIHRDTPNNESIIVEYGFVDNESDANKIKKNYKQYAESVVKAISDYKGIKYYNDDYYTVVKGDNLWNLAKKYNTTVANIKSENNLKSDLLKIGQKLKITPNTKEASIKNEYKTYKVVKGDNLWNLAKKYNTTVSKLKSINNLKSDLLKIGQTLKIPN